MSIPVNPPPTTPKPDFQPKGQRDTRPDVTIRIKRSVPGFESEVTVSNQQAEGDIAATRRSVQREVDDAVRQHRLMAEAEEREIERVAYLEEIDEQLELAVKQRDALVAKRTKNPTETSYDERIAAAQGTVDQLSAVRAANEQPITYNYER